MWLDIGLFIASIIFLVIASEVVIQTLSKISGYLRVSEYVAAFILMAVATSIPELFVGITSALEKNAAIVLGTVIGANILNLTIVIGLPILIAGGITVRNKKMKKDTFYMFLLAALPSVLMLLGSGISRIDGIILILAFCAYGWHAIRERKGFRKRMSTRLSHWQAVYNSLLFAAAIIVLFASAHFAVRSATNISMSFGLPPIFIGLFIISIGTTLPEIIVGIKAARSKHTSIAIGDVIGSVVTNSTLIIGVAAIISPIQANIFLFLISTAFMLLAAFLFSTFIESGSKLYQKEGVALILLYVLFLLVELNIKGFFPGG